MYSNEHKMSGTTSSLNAECRKSVIVRDVETESDVDDENISVAGIDQEHDSDNKT
jgi:hypothetical protein